MTIPGTVPNSESAASANTLAIQQAINGVGAVDLGPGKFYINGTLNLRNNLLFTGSSVGETVLRQLNPSVDILHGADLIHCTIQNMTLQGTAVGSSHGINIQYVTRPSNYVRIQNAEIINCGGDGVRMDHAVLTKFDQVICQKIGGCGFRVLDGTSVSWETTYANVCGDAGYSVNSLNYSSLRGTATDSCGTGYLIKDCRSIEMSGCGSELITGFALRIDETISFSASSFRNYNNLRGFCLITAGSKGIKLVAPFEETPTSTAMFSLQVDPGCSQIRIELPQWTSKTNIAPGTTTIVTS